MVVDGQYPESAILSLNIKNRIVFLRFHKKNVNSNFSQSKL